MKNIALNSPNCRRVFRGLRSALQIKPIREIAKQISHAYVYVCYIATLSRIVDFSRYRPVILSTEIILFFFEKKNRD